MHDGQDVTDVGELGSGAAGGAGPGPAWSGDGLHLAGLGGLRSDTGAGRGSRSGADPDADAGSGSETGPSSRRAPYLVIGIGSPLRRDDAVGHAVVAALTARGRDDVEALSVHQLTPEVAAVLEGRLLVVFVDAAVDTDHLTVTRLTTDASGRLLTHHLGAAGLLDLAAGLGWSPGAAALVRLPVEDLDIGTGLSTFGQAQVEPAVEAVIALLD